MNVRLKKLQSETMRLITESSTSGMNNQESHSSSQMSFKERLTSPIGSQLLSPTNAGERGGNVQEVIQIIQQKRIKGLLQGRNSPNGQSFAPSPSQHDSTMRQSLNLFNQSISGGQKPTNFLETANSSSLSFKTTQGGGENKVLFQKSLAEVLRQRREFQERIEQERNQLN